MSEIYLTTGNLTITGEIDVLINTMKLQLFIKFRKAFLKAVSTAKQFITSNVKPKIALDRALMRVAFMNALEVTETKGRSNFEAEFNFNMTRFIDNVRSPKTGVRYAVFHITGHPQFNFPGGYRRPTTPGTKPISFKFWTIVERLLTADLHSNLIMEGFSV